MELPANPGETILLLRGRQRGFIGVKLETRFLATMIYAPEKKGHQR